MDASVEARIVEGPVRKAGALVLQPDNSVDDAFAGGCFSHKIVQLIESAIHCLPVSPQVTWWAVQRLRALCKEPHEFMRLPLFKMDDDGHDLLAAQLEIVHHLALEELAPPFSVPRPIMVSMQVLTEEGLSMPLPAIDIPLFS